MMATNPSLFPSMVDVPSQNKFVPPKPPQVQGKAPLANSQKQPSAAQAVEAEQITIRTMKDDLAAPPKPPMPGGIGQSKVKGSPKQASGANQASVFSSFPIAAKVNNGKSVVLPPNSAPKKRSYKQFIVAALIIAVAAGAGAGVWYMMREGAGLKLSPDIENPLELIPADAVSITEYVIGDDDKRQAITSLWSKQSQLQASISTLLKGDPRILTSDLDTTNVYYITIPSETRPFLLTKKTSALKGMLENPSEGKTIEKSGWYITHELSTDSYINSLNQGNMATSGKVQAFTQPYTIRVFLSKEAASQIMSSSSLGQLAQSHVDSVTIISNQVGDDKISFEGIHSHPVANNPTTSLDQVVVTNIPATATFAVAGNDLAQAIKNVQVTNPTIIDKTIIEEPAVKQLLSLLGQSFSYYIRENSAGGNDMGLIISLPVDLEKNLLLGDQALERSLSALAPLITGRSQPISLVFSDAFYKELSLKYANLGGPTQALDYAIFDNLLLIATSKDGMFALIDEVKPTALSSPPFAPSLLGSTLELSGKPGNYAIVGSIINDSSAKFILPGINTSLKPAFMAGVRTITNTTDAVEASITLSQTLIPSESLLSE